MYIRFLFILLVLVLFAVRTYYLCTYVVYIVETPPQCVCILYRTRIPYSDVVLSRPTPHTPVQLTNAARWCSSRRRLLIRRRSPTITTTLSLPPLRPPTGIILCCRALAFVRALTFSLVARPLHIHLPLPLPSPFSPVLPRTMAASRTPDTAGHGSIDSISTVLSSQPSQRTASIDSQSSVFSPLPSSHHRPSVDVGALSSADIAALIAAAGGSPEAAIAKLLKEKQHAASQNSQLWKLVERQRTMVFGLNRDLERVMKDKDHYKRRFKDLHGRIIRGSPTIATHKDDRMQPFEGDSDCAIPFLFLFTQC